MTHLPDFYSHGYQTTKQLPNHPEDSFNSYQAKRLKDNKCVVIKQARLTIAGDSSGSEEALKHESNVLKKLLDCSSIPPYLDSFQSKDGFCLVQEYKNTKPLSSLPGLTPQEVKNLAIKILPILVYLQQQDPPVIHGNITPQNLLIDTEDASKIYLNDFSLAQIDSKELNLKVSE